MQIYPMNFIYAAICLVLIPISVFGGDYIIYYLGNIWWIPFIFQAIPALCLAAAVSFILTSVNVEVWDTGFRWH